MWLYAASGQQTTALRQYERAAQVLKDELDLPPSPETTALYEAIRRGEMAPSPVVAPPDSISPQSAKHNLAAPTTPLVGRTTEIAELTQLCADSEHRLITILGPGGIGKTRLALAVAHHMVQERNQDTFMVYLARLSDPATIIPAIADALTFQFQTDGRASKTQLLAYLAPKQLYLVLDNFEHLLDGVHLIQELLEQCPHVRLLVTTRERLKLTSATVYTLRSLDFPTWETPAQLEHYDAIHLFMETARRIQPNVVFHAEEMQYVARICRMVGGMPLGIILAATWVEHLSPATIATELTQGFDLLETELRDLPERQRSMQAVLDYSWQRLTPSEQGVFMRLAIFQGGFTRTAARVVGGASLPVLAHLVDKSFIQSLGDERYEIHELLRQYAAQHLAMAGAFVETQQLHANYYLYLLQDAEGRLSGAEQLTAIRQIEADFENLRSAWQWAVMSDEYRLIDQALDGLFCWFWLRRSRQQEGLTLLNMAYQRLSADGTKEMRSIWGRIAVRMVEQQGPWLVEPAIVRERAERALTIAKEQNSKAEIALCHWVIGLTIVSANWQQTEVELSPAIPHYEIAIATYQEIGNYFWLAQVLELVGHTYRQMDAYERASPFLQKTLTLRSTLGDRFGLARSYREIAWVRYYQGMERETLDAAEKAVSMQREFGDQQGIADSQFFLALSLLCCADWKRAKQLLKPVQEFATETQSALYRRWSGHAWAIATAMELCQGNRQTITSPFLYQFGQFTARLMPILFGMRTKWVRREPEGYRRNLLKLLKVAETEDEMATSLVFAADLWTRIGNSKQAVQYLALACRFPTVTADWISYFPAFLTLQQTLREQLSPAEFEQAWTEGQALDLDAVVAELLIAD